ncbi:isopenicillin N synthase family oxygenase [Nakamurella antarctica]|uniref:Isopenicillin N synthase family oxygenase n=1 Tax=Nakamurella antarctica TaxID=1902245 RepID=A0A3G8ZNM1_9ACTN|nr:2OG-Fe(II) oxygenase family protein [Nakamurella antarctica]AZI58728.1 isopenicillin N synthase family oxygenase [Nakamurella antarctica]
MAYVPVIDLSLDDLELAPVLSQVCTEVGFFQVINHGMPSAVEQRTWSALTAFFDLPLAEKLALTPENIGDPYGYIPVSAESLAASLGVETPGDVKESINIGPIDPPTHELSGPDEAIIYTENRWPESLPELKETCREYYDAMTLLSERIMRLFALALDLPAEYFNPLITHAPSALRAVNYPANETPLAKGQLRAGAHTDYGLLTILHQDTVGGLEVVDSSGKWVAVPSIDGAYVVNIGDLMARWTNDTWRSTLHRVVNPVEGEASAARRQSVPFFYNANWDAIVECLPSCLPPGESPKYESAVAGPHLMTKFHRTATPS